MPAFCKKTSSNQSCFVALGFHGVSDYLEVEVNSEIYSCAFLFVYACMNFNHYKVLNNHVLLLGQSSSRGLLTRLTAMVIGRFWTTDVQRLHENSG